MEFHMWALHTLLLHFKLEMSYCFAEATILVDAMERYFTRSNELKGADRNTVEVIRVLACRVDDAERRARHRNIMQFRLRLTFNSVEAGIISAALHAYYMERREEHALPYKYSQQIEMSSNRFDKCHMKALKKWERGFNERKERALFAHEASWYE